MYQNDTAQSSCKINDVTMNTDGTVSMVLTSFVLAPPQRSSSNNTSGYKGVSWHTRDKAWRAYIKINQKARSLGYYKTPEEAAQSYDKAARELFGEFALVNFPDELA